MCINSIVHNMMYVSIYKADMFFTREHYLLTHYGDVEYSANRNLIVFQTFL